MNRRKFITTSAFAGAALGIPPFWGCLFKTVGSPRVTEPPAEFSGNCVPVDVKYPVTMATNPRVRPQSTLYNGNGQLERLFYTLEPPGKVSIGSALAQTWDGGRTWADSPANPVLNRLESDWQGVRAFVTTVTRDTDHDRWVMATVGNDESDKTPGMRATGLWFSDNLVNWTQYSGNPIITVKTDNALNNKNLFPESSPPVGMYLRHFRKINDVWYALVQWRGPHTWSRMTIMKSGGDITGPWKFRNLCLDPEDATAWFKKNRKLNWSEPICVNGRWYAGCQNGVGENDKDNDHIGIVYSDDYFHWSEVDGNPVTPPLTRPDGSTVVSSQQLLLPPEGNIPWRFLIGTRGNHGRSKGMYLVYPKGCEC